MTTSSLFYVYEHWRLDRDECFYVGKGKGGRAYSVKNRNRHHQAIVAKLSRIGSAFEIRIVASGLSEQDAFALEVQRIQFWRNAGVDLTNMTTGGEGNSGFERSPELRMKMSIANKGKKRSLETKKKMSEAFKGRIISAEARKKISDKLKGQPSSFKGCKHSEETKSLLSEIAKKRGAPKLTKKQKQKAADWHRGRKRSPETCAKISEKAQGRTSPMKGKVSPSKGLKRNPDFCKNLAEKTQLRWDKIRAENGGVIVGRKLSNEERLNLSIQKKIWWAAKKMEKANGN